MRVAIVDKAFDPWEELGRTVLPAGRCGALACFVGILRAEAGGSHGEPVQAMTLEHYPEMSRVCLQDLADAARREWQLTDLLLLHRVGRIALNEAIMLVACWSGHRHEALRASEQIVEQLKSTAPFWKKEHTASGDHWVVCNTPPPRNTP